MVGSCGQGPESSAQKQGKLMVLAVQHFECQGPQIELEVCLGPGCFIKADVGAKNFSKYNSFGMAKALRRRRIASCEKMCCSLSPIKFNSCVFLEIEAVIKLTSPIGYPSKVASQGSMNWALGNSSYDLFLFV